jgi:hypothetical protein
MLPKRLRQNELLAAYVEPLASGRRVVVIGDDAAGLGDRLAELGARAVHAYEIGPAPEPKAAPGVVVKRLGREGDLDVRDGAFDLAVLPDAGAIVDLEAVLARVRRWIGAAGVVVVGAAADGSPGYYELYDGLALSFSEIAMVGQVPFHGAALAVLGDEGEPEVTVDTQLAGDASAPTHFLAIASQSPLSLRPYVILQLPLASDDDERDEQDERERAEREGAADREAAAAIQRELERDRERAEHAEAQLRSGVLQSQLDAQRERLVASGEVVRQLEQELARRDEQARILVQSARAAEALADGLRARLEDAARVVVARDQELEFARARAAELESAVDQARALDDTADRARHASIAAESLEAELLEFAESHAAEVAALAASLRERGRALHALERELDRRGRMIHELLIAIDHAPPGDAPRPRADADLSDAAEIERLGGEAAHLRAKLEALAADAARREGELQAMRWRIEELELQSSASARVEAPPVPVPAARAEARGSPESPDAAASGEALERLREELEVLRQALRQEHDARLRAESGDELQKARAEIQRQAVMLEQLRTERNGSGDASATG